MPATERNMWFDYLLEQYIHQSYNHTLLEPTNSNFTYRHFMLSVLQLSVIEIVSYFLQLSYSIMFVLTKSIFLYEQVLL